MTHTDPDGQKVIIRWLTRNKESIILIRKRFHIPRYTTINGLSPAILKPEDVAEFEETARRGYFSYRTADWTFNGATYSW